MIAVRDRDGSLYSGFVNYTSKKFYGFKRDLGQDLNSRGNIDWNSDGTILVGVGNNNN
jgi:hypothetical protein